MAYNNRPSRLGDGYVSLTPVVNNFQGQITQQLNQSIASTSQASQQASQQLGQSVGSNAGQTAGPALGRTLIAGVAALGLGAMIGDQISKAIDQMDINNKLSAALNLSPEESAKVAEASSALYSQAYGESYEAVSEAMKGIVGSVKEAKNATADELFKMGRDVLNLQDTFGISGEYIQNAIQSMTGSGLAKDWNEAVSIIAGGYQTFGASGEDWVESLVEFSDDFARFGLSGESSINLVNAAITAGIKDTDKLADSLNELSIRLQDGTADETLTALGLDPERLRAGLEAGGAAAQQVLTDVLGTLQAEGSLEQWAAIVGTVSEDYQIAMQNMDLGALSAGLAEGVGNMQLLDETLNAGPAASMEAFGRTIEQVFINLLIPVIEMVSPPLQALATFLAENEWAATLLGVAVGGVLLIALVATTAALWGMAAAGWAAIAPFLPIIGIILLVVAAVAALVAGIWWLATNWDAVVTFLGEVWAGFVYGLQQGIEAVGNFFTDLGRNIGNFFIGIVNFIIDAMNGLIGLLNSTGIDLPDWVGGGRIGFEIETIGKLPQLAKGGLVKKTAGGSAVITGEGQNDEAVLPLTPELQALVNGEVGTSSSVVFNITQQPGETTEELVQRIESFYDFNGLKG